MAAPVEAGLDETEKETPRELSPLVDFGSVLSELTATDEQDQAETVEIESEAAEEEPEPREEETRLPGT